MPWLTFHYVALAIFEAAWRCPEASVTNGRCSWVTASEVHGLAKSSNEQAKARLKDANQILASCRADLPAAGVHDDWDATKLCKIFARLDVCVARFVLDNQEQSKAKFATD